MDFNIIRWLVSRTTPNCTPTLTDFKEKIKAMVIEILNQNQQLMKKSLGEVFGPYQDSLFLKTKVQNHLFAFDK